MNTRRGDCINQCFFLHLMLWQTSAGARVVAKRSPSEKVGVFARRGGCIEVVEYSELGQAEAEAVLEGGGICHYWPTVASIAGRQCSK